MNDINYISEIVLTGEDSTTKVLITKDIYIIPIYQREFAWGDEETESKMGTNSIRQMLEDINSFTEDTEDKYYLGTMAVSYNEEKTVYEVIDGQQRLTTIYLLFCYLELTPPNLSFALREESTKILKELRDKKNLQKILAQDNSLVNGYGIIEKFFKEGHDKGKFKEKLERVIIYRVVIPEGTDLNWYFEIMNTRGKQLEQQDILKARLMSRLTCDNAKKNFAKIWDACSNMSDYIQTNIKDDSLRKKLFGEGLYSPNIDNFGLNIGEKDAQDKKTIIDIINDTTNSTNASNIKKDKEDTYRGIIDFPYFLLHSLRVYLYKYTNISDISEIPLDEKKLVQIFENYNLNSCEFIRHLLICRYLFDKYFIKRTTTPDPEWTLKKICRENNNTAYKDTFKNENDNIRMLQACLRVSYTSQSSMDWITKMLIFLFEKFEKKETMKEDFEKEFEKKLENYIASKVDESFKIEDSSEDKISKYSYGSTPHIVFNYLDYLLWRGPNSDKPEIKELWKPTEGIHRDNFEFEFRNTVEHFYPQKPSPYIEQKADQDKIKTINNFGNLCLLSQKWNSIYSNRSPSAKVEEFDVLIQKDSLKLRIMAKWIIDNNNNNQKWLDEGCIEHAEAMCKILAAGLEQVLNDNANQADTVNNNGSAQ